MRPADDVLVHREDGEAFLLHVGSGRYFGLNPTGLVVWEALVAGRDPVTALRERWPDLDLVTCEADVSALVTSLEAAGLVRAADQPSGPP